MKKRKLWKRMALMVVIAVLFLTQEISAQDYLQIEKGSNFGETEIEATGGSKKDQSELVYKSGGSYYTVNTFGETSYQSISRNAEFYLKWNIDNELIQGSILKLYVISDTNGAYATDTYTYKLQMEGNGYYYDNSWPNPKYDLYIPISNALENQQGSIRLYYDVTLANGHYLEQCDPSLTDGFYVTLLGEYNVLYDTNGGMGGPLSQTKYRESTLTISSQVPTRSGYTFKGWATDSTTNVVSYQPGDSYTDNQDMTLYAVWRQNVSSGMPENPVHYCTQKDDGSDDTDWSYVYFGSYPQSEVTGSALTDAIIGASYDANGDAWVSGTKYRRISKGDANNDKYFGDSAYRYFKWERIKWRVLENNGSTLFVMADRGLDCKNYHDASGDVTWENSTLRNWLNHDFYQTAFSSNEQNAIVQQNVLNEDNPKHSTEGGNHTRDKVYLLSIGEVANPEYGFCESYDTYSVSRGVKVSDYAHARGAFINTGVNYSGNCKWWLRSPGDSTNHAARVDYDGYVSRSGFIVYVADDACVPALHINLSSDLWSQTDDGTSGAGGIVPIIPTVSSPSSQRVKAGTSAVFQVQASGGNPSMYTYQWYYATSQNGTGTRIGGATSSTYTISSGSMTSALNGRYYYCVVSNGVYDVTSDRAKLTVYSPPDVLSPKSQSVKEGSSATFQVQASGGNPSTYTYQWYYATSQSGTGVRISGATSSTYTISSGSMTTALNGRYYYCVVNNGEYGVTSGRAKLTVQSNGSSSETNQPPAVSGLSEWYSAAAGTSLNLAVTASGGRPDTYTYQWYYASSEFGAGTKINGAVLASYTIPPSEMTLSINGRYYYCIVSNGAYDVESRRTKLFVYRETNPDIGAGGNGTTVSAQIIQADSYTKEYGSKDFFIQATTNGNGILTYQSDNKKVAVVSSNGLVKLKGYGTAVITINASQTSAYKSASKQIAIKVVPKKVKLKKVQSPGKRRISMKWKKNKKASGYEIYISSSKKFKSNTIRRTYPKSKTNVALIGLRSGKKYYVRIRSYVKAGKKVHYSEWSKTKSVKIK